MTTALELVGMACIVAFGFMVWPPSALLLAGLFALSVSRNLTPKGSA